MERSTADLCDAHSDIQVVQPLFHDFGGRRAFHGPIATVRIADDNTSVRALLEQPGAGRVLVVDNGGSLHCAVVGDQLATLLHDNGWAGIVVYGCIRDSRAIGEMDIGVLALDTHPLKSIKKNVGEAEIAVSFGGVTFVPGHYLYADEDGVLVSPTALLA